MHEEAALYLYVVFDGSFIPQECCTRNKKKCGRAKNNKVIMIKYDGKFNIFYKFLASIYRFLFRWMLFLFCVCEFVELY